MIIELLLVHDSYDLLFQQDCLTLKNVKHNLNEGATLHSSQCTETPSFGIVSPVGIPNLLMTCDVSN